MNEKFLQYYNRELSYLRDEGVYFATQYPKIASRLGMNSIDVPDPYIERLLEGIAFLNARTNLKIDASYPRFVSNILEVIHPQLLNPKPACAIVEFDSTQNQALNAINKIRRGDVLQSLPFNVNDQKVNCTFCATQELELSPLKLESVNYIAATNSPSLTHITTQTTYSILKLDLSIAAPYLCSDLIPEKIKIFLGHDVVSSSQLLYLLMNCCSKVVCHNPDKSQPWSYTIHEKPEHLGFSDNESLTINTDKNIAALRVIQDYIQLPEKFLFIGQKGIREAIQYAETQGFIEKNASQAQKTITENGVNKRIIDYQKRHFCLSFVFSETNKELIHSLVASTFSISATPIVNIFKKKGVRFSVDANQKEHHVVADRVQPLNYEIYAIDEVTAYDKHNQKIMTYRPFYQYYNNKHNSTFSKNAYFSVTRDRRLAHDDKVYRTSYLGHETFVSLSNVLSEEPSNNLHQIALDVWCTNRDLPILMPLGTASDFLIEESLPVKSIKLIKKLTRPKEAIDDQNSLWSLLNLMRLNYASLLNLVDNEGTQYLKEMLSSFPHDKNDLLRQNIDAVTNVRIQPTKKLIRDGLHSGIVRGLKVELTIDEGLMGGVHPFLFGSVLRYYLASIISVNSFLEFSLEMVHSKEIIRWSHHLGGRFIL